MYGLIHTIVIAECVLVDNRFLDKHIEKFLFCLPSVIGMKVADIDQPFSIWEDHATGEDFKDGISANIFIETSNISVHASDPQKTIRICIFTCKQHDEDTAVKFSEEYWECKCIQSTITEVL